MILDLPLPVAAAVAAVSAVAAWLFRDEGWRRAAVIAVTCGLASAALAASRLPSARPAGPAPPPAAAATPPAAFPLRLAGCGPPASPQVAPMLAVTAAQDDFNLALRPGEPDWPVGCVPFALAALCAHWRFPASVPRREAAINVGGTPAAWTIGGAPYRYAGADLAGLQALMVDIGALAKTDYGRAGSGTSWDDMEGALVGLGFGVRRAVTLDDVVVSVRIGRPALVSVSLDPNNPAAKHCAVADGLGTADDGSVSLHLRFLLRRSDDGGWFSRNGTGKPATLNRASVGIEPRPPPPTSFPVVPPAARK